MSRTTLRRHLSRLLPFLGLTVVAATFIVKESKRDEVKEFAQSLDNANSLATTREEVHTLIRKIPAGGLQIRFRMPNAQLRSELADVVMSDETLLGDIILTGHEASSVAETSHQEIRLREVNRSLEAVPDLMRKIENARNVSVAAESTKSQLLSTYNEMVAANEQLLSLDARLRPVTLSIMMRSLDLSREKKREYEHYKTLSYVLYGIGWIISFIGKLLHVETSPAE